MSSLPRRDAGAPPWPRSPWRGVAAASRWFPRGRKRANRPPRERRAAGAPGAGAWPRSNQRHAPGPRRPGAAP
eukprot:7490387-Lingulodinium_polyedra.AAC.1